MSKVSDETCILMEKDITKVNTKMYKVINSIKINLLKKLYYLKKCFSNRKLKM